MSNTSMVELLKRRIEEVLRDWRFVSEQMNEFSEWNSMEDLKRNFGLLTEFVPRLVLATEAARKDLTKALGTIVSSSAARKALKETIELEHVGGAGLYLLSDLSARVTGEIHYVDSGYNIIGLPRAEEMTSDQDNGN